MGLARMCAGLWGLLVLAQGGRALALAAAAPTGAPACAPAAELEGDPGFVAPVARELDGRGISGRAASGCPPVHARVSGADGELVVEVVDGAGRRAVRRTATAASAATVIESWARTELTDGMLERREAELRTVSVDPASGQAALPVRTPLITAALESSLGSDGSIWAGARLSGCAWLGPVCAGVTLRFATDRGWAGDSDLASGHRSAADMLVAFELPARTPRLVVAPGLAAGFGWLRSHSRESDGDRIDLDWEGPRAEAHVRVGTPITGGLWLTVAASASFLPTASTEMIMHDGALVAAEPRGFLRLAIGLSSSESP